MPEPRLRLTVPRDLWDEMAAATYPDFADSYLSGADVIAGVLVPHTVTAYQRLRSSASAMSVIGTKNLKLREPLPFGHPGRGGR